jgi:hypothetical protein
MRSSSSSSLLSSKYVRLVIVMAVIAFVVIFYVVPNTLGKYLVSNTIAAGISCNQLQGVVLTVRNSYFLAVVLSYDGPDLLVDIRDKDGVKVHRASFLSEELHDEEEGRHHVALIEGGEQTFVLPFSESTQYYETAQLPRLPSDNYHLSGQAFGLDVDSDKQQPVVIGDESQAVDCANQT